MEEQLVQILANLGLNSKEAKVYLACLENGHTVVSNIAQSAKINRVTTYDILEKLKKKGLVSYITKKKTKYFTPTDPEIVLEEYEKRTNDLRKYLPKFKMLSGEISHPRVRYFEGLEGIKTIYADTLTAKTDILNYANSYEIRKIWPNYDEEYVKKRVKKNIYLKGISPKDKTGKYVHSHDKESKRELRLVPQEEFNFSNEINIYDDKVSIISFKNELIGMLIESSEIANSQRAIFNMTWQFAGIYQDNTSIRNRLLKPLSEKELSQIPVEETQKAKSKKENLSLF